MEPKNVVISIVLGLLILAVGFGGGVLYESIGQPPAQNVVQEAPEGVKVLNSKITPSITAYGVITDINGKNITIDNQGDTMTITVVDGAKIYAFSSTSGQSKEITLQDLKKGDNLSVNVKVSQNGQVQAHSIIVLPPAVKNK